MELGHADFYRGLAEEAGMDEETQELLRDLIENKNYFGAEALLTSQGMKEASKQGFLKLLELFGPADQIKAGQNNPYVQSTEALKAIERLQKIQELLEDYGLEDSMFPMIWGYGQPVSVLYRYYF